MIWDADSSSAPFTAEDLRAAAKAIYEQRGPDPCRLGQHVVSPKALHRPGIYRCVNCSCPVEIPYPLSER